MAAKKDGPPVRMIAQNRKARHNYTIEETLESGVMLTGSEVKSLRKGGATIGEAFAREQDGAIYMINAHIPEYTQAGQFNHEPRRPRKLLLHKRQIDRLLGAIQREGVTLIPLQLYFNERGMVKIQLGLGKGKRQHDKRESEKNRDWDRQKGRLLRARG